MLKYILGGITAHFVKKKRTTQKSLDLIKGSSGQRMWMIRNNSVLIFLDRNYRCSNQIEDTISYNIISNFWFRLYGLLGCAGRIYHQQFHIISLAIPQPKVGSLKHGGMRESSFLRFLARQSPLHRICL